MSERPAALELLDIFGIHITEELWFTAMSDHARSEMVRTLFRARIGKFGVTLSTSGPAHSPEG